MQIMIHGVETADEARERARCMLEGRFSEPPRP